MEFFIKRYLLLIVLLFSACLVHGQEYEQAIGIRGGLTPGIEYRYYTSDVNSFKALLGTRNRGLQLHVFTEFYRYDLFSVSSQLVFLYGFGAHVGYESWDVIRYGYMARWYDTRSALLAGLDGLTGLEYVFHEVPLSVGLEVKPYFDLLGRHGFDIQLFDFALTLKYLF